MKEDQEGRSEDRSPMTIFEWPKRLSTPNKEIVTTTGRFGKIRSRHRSMRSDYAWARPPADRPIAAQGFGRKAAPPRASDNRRADRAQRFFEHLPVLAHSRREPSLQPLRP